MIKRIFTMCILFGFLTYCTTVKPQDTPANQEVQAPVWSLQIEGVVTAEVTAAFFNEAKQHSSHYRELRLMRKGVEQVYLAMPLHLIVAMADGAETVHPYTFDRALWEKGYDITVTGRDGYTATFSTAEISWQALFLADNLDGKPVAPCLVGDVAGNLWVKDITEIELGLIETQAQVPAEDFVLTLEVNGKSHAWPLSALKASPYYREDKGSYTTSAGTRYSNVYGGIPLAPFLSQYLPLQPETGVRLIAMDAYEMVYKASELLDEAAGTWILAFIMDGEPLPRDPGFIRTIKIGPEDPNIDGHLSVKMVQKIVVEGGAYRDFSLTITGKLDTVLDRQTLQSGVNCHKRQVNFERKNTQARYTGIPLWLLLAYADDDSYAPHKQDKAVLSYNSELAQAGYRIEITAGDGFTVVLDSREVHKNDDLILALYKDGAELPEGEWPLMLVWDKDARVVPDGIKPVKMIESIRLVF